MQEIDPKHYWRNEYTAVRNHIAAKAKKLWEHDNCKCNNSASNSRQTGFSVIKNCQRWIIEDRVFWVLYDNTMGDAILTDWIHRALKSLPIIEGERCIYDILDALLKSYAKSKKEFHHYQNRLDDYGGFLKKRYGYIVEVTSNQQNPNFKKHYYENFNRLYQPKITEGITLSDNIFRIKLFDSIGEQKNKEPVRCWFNSGLFHCLKHFSIGGVNIAGKQKKGGKAKPPINCLREIVEFYVIRALYFTELKESKKKKDTFESHVECASGEKHKVIFYLEKNNSFYSLDTIIPQGKKQLLKK